MTATRLACLRCGAPTNVPAMDRIRSVMTDDERAHDDEHTGALGQWMVTAEERRNADAALATRRAAAARLPEATCDDVSHRPFRIAYSLARVDA
jgi:hypothetical protein